MDERARRAMLNRNIAGLAVREWLVWLGAAPVIIAASVSAGRLFA